MDINPFGKIGIRLYNMQNNRDSRYSRHYQLTSFGPSGQEKLSQTKVLVIGAGGLGCPVLQYLAAAGIGKLGIVDGDQVELSNLQRQVLYSEIDLGLPKARIAAHKLKLMNRNIKIEVYEEFLTKDNAQEIAAEYDIIVDGSDNFATRYLVNDLSQMLGKPLVFGSILGFEGQVSVFNYGPNCPSYRCVFPDPPAPADSPSCSEAGVIGALPGIIGSLQAMEVIKIASGIGKPLAGKLLIYNALDNNQYKIKLSQSTDLKKINSLDQKEYFYHCEFDNHEIAAEEFLQNQNQWEGRLIDLREAHERNSELEVGRNIPFSELGERKEIFSEIVDPILICQTGKRSQAAINFLHSEGLLNLYHIKGGWDELSKLADK